MTYTVKIRENSLFMNLSIENRGEAAFVCSPGFHPYFPTTDATKVVIQSDVTRQFDTEALAATQFLPPHQERVLIDLDTMKVTIASTTLQRYAVWSANPDRYICVEPTWAGNLADQPELPKLTPGERREFDTTLTWEVL
jgi:galactose mutarotase-like enzyme